MESAKNVCWFARLLPIVCVGVLVRVVHVLKPDGATTGCEREPAKKKVTCFHLTAIVTVIHKDSFASLRFTSSTCVCVEGGGRRGRRVRRRRLPVMRMQCGALQSSGPGAHRTCRFLHHSYSPSLNFLFCFTRGLHSCAHPFNTHRSECATSNAVSSPPP